MKLTSEQLGELSSILQDAFDPFRFDEMLSYRLGINRQNIALGANFAEIIFRVLSHFQARHTTTDLVMAAREANSENPDLIAFAQQFGLSPATLVRRDDALVPTASQRELEREIRKSNSIFDVVGWRTKLGEIESQVCRIEIDDGEAVIYGTGFLVGPACVITNYHVMEDVIKKKVKPERVVLRFDYKKSEDGTTINSGTVYRLEAEDDDWLIDHSEGSAVDGMVDPKGQLPGDEQLDYALLRVKDEPGKKRVGGEKGAPSAPTRKWINVPRTPPEIVAEAPLYIMQHPNHEPLKLAIDTSAIIGVNGNGTRVRYRTNTERGSSGAPCFNKDWGLMALHHSGDPNYSRFYKPQFNEGIPIAAIYNLLQKRGKASELGQQAPGS
ncbi:MAG TPA: trypsin-like peptidase domain-containing protein [Pyrinomonadaceae bacterium]